MPRTVDRLTFDELMLEHLVPAQRFAIRLTGDVDAAEDVVQTALVRAARSWQTFGGRSTFRSWLFQIVVNACRDRRSCRPSPGPLPEGLADEVIRIPECHEAVLPIVATVPVQLLSYYIAVELKRDVDKPRNLAKSVTVE